MPRKRGGNDPVQEELDAIKRLLVLQLITSGVQAGDVAKALRVSPATISGMVPARKVKKAPRRR
jgi:hypothetical protein